MIYQLKILLKQTKPPRWRRVLVKKDMTFADLHEVIQIAFNWEGLFLHGFEPKKVNGKDLSSLPILIRPQEYDGEVFKRKNNEYNDNEELLSKWLVCENDKLTYVYDYGNYFQHDIILEKIVPYNSDLHYPYCVKATLGNLPEVEEDWGFTDPEQLKDDINSYYKDFSLTQT
ncbi:MAG: plasmid pRiA4b ORF-3 family protein [Cytobacillus gottheilii]|uniref:plasmid pRiA4b ORF-3 family protein n=1 Tax=Cytobacillus gottheilii TaxID=859144 RepID=UPI00082B0185|nr:plasmid pRiA4b ORF-3 family protein [Cytobacillus gottheilii]